MSELLNLLQNLIAFPSITPKDAGCQQYMIDFLSNLGFRIHQFPNAPVDNFYAEIGHSGPSLVFAGHTDVVAAGNLSHWQSPPFEANLSNDKVYGRGVADMKGSLAAMLIATKDFLKDNPCFNGRLGFLITSGEEGDQFDLGTPYVMKQLQQLNCHIDYCIVGEPSSTHTVGDVIKIGRRGSLTGELTLYGKQGHVAYPHLAINPIHKAASVLNILCSTQWDNGNQYFPATTMQISNIHAGTGEGNVIPAQLTLKFNFRYCTETNDTSLRHRVEHLLKQHDLNYDINWRLNGQPFLTNPGVLIEACQQAIHQTVGLEPQLSTSGGTSDARFIAPYGVEVIELGPVNATIHQVNECTDLHQLHQLKDIYLNIAQKLLT